MLALPEDAEQARQEAVLPTLVAVAIVIPRLMEQPLDEGVEESQGFDALALDEEVSPMR